MAFPWVVAVTTPDDGDDPSLGAGVIRDLKQGLSDAFQLPASVAAALTITRVGPYTNSTGGPLVAGNVVALSTAGDSAVVLSDSSASQAQFVVALASIASGATGVFGQTGLTTVTVQGVVTRGHYLRKSATTLALEDTGTSHAAGASIPTGSVGVALTAAAGPGAGTCVAQMFGITMAAAANVGGYFVRGLTGANNSGTPNTKMDLAADLVQLRNATDGTVAIRTGTGTVTNDVGLVGPAANGRDQIGAFTSGSWVHFYWIWNGTTLATVSSATAPSTGPTLPAGYTHWAYAGANYYDTDPKLVRMHWRGAVMLYDAAITVVGAANPAANAEQSVSVANQVPPNALRFLLDSSAFYQDNGTTA